MRRGADPAAKPPLSQKPNPPTLLPPHRRRWPPGRSRRRCGGRWWTRSRAPSPAASPAPSRPRSTSSKSDSRYPPPKSLVVVPVRLPATARRSIGGPRDCYLDRSAGTRFQGCGRVSGHLSGEDVGRFDACYMSRLTLRAGAHIAYLQEIGFASTSKLCLLVSISGFSTGELLGSTNLEIKYSKQLATLTFIVNMFWCPRLIFNLI
jgi:hypothetical protein